MMDTPTRAAIYVAKEMKKRIEGGIFYKETTLVRSACAQWALEEVIRRLRSSCDPPLVVIESFQEEMMIFSKVDKRTSRYFQAAERTLDELVSMLIKGE